MRIHHLIFASILLTLGIAALPAAGQMSIVQSKHNLSASGPGTIRATNQQQVCIFCHTPHNASPVQPLWNRNLPVAAYTPYTSSSLQARPGQPTGVSKLCLSCHDGTIAIGSVISGSQHIFMAGGVQRLAPGHAGYLGTDLSDDHPISFKYDQELVAKNPKLKSPLTLPQRVRLDHQQELQCTTCHDAHDNQFGKFLVLDNSNSQLCNSCHLGHGATDIQAHVNCASCHVPHSAPSGAHLLAGATVNETCTRCHNAQDPAAANILTELAKVSSHDSRPPPAEASASFVGPRTGEVTGRFAPRTDVHTGCSSCHDSHTMSRQGVASAPFISPRLGAVRGVDASGAPVARAEFEYQVCFRCHAEQGANVAPVVSRQIVQNNTRLEFDPSAISFHPVEAPGRSSDVPSLRPGLTTASIIYCTDCHSSDVTAAGVAAPRGPHGSNNPPLLAARYDTMDGTAESAEAYALCYRCHDRNSILSDVSFTGHKLHVVDQNTPCSVCHDAHGISSTQGTPQNNARLMNFDVKVVRPNSAGRLEYVSTGNRAGSCYLTCHGVEHAPRSYPPLGGGGIPQLQQFRNPISR